jgi:HSP20 family protein
MTMNVRDLIPWGRTRSAPATYNDNPFLTLHREVNRLFDDFFRGFDAPSPFGRWNGWGTWPSVEVSETDKEIRVAAEMPGLEEKDVEVLLDDGILTLRGERKSETESADRYFSERFYGRFERRIPLEAEIDEDKVEASFKNGVLTVTLPKTAEAQEKARRIPVNGRR